MRAVRKNGISWFLDDGEELERTVEALTENDTLRRSYSVRDCGDRKVFVKYFLEKGIAGFVRNRISPRGRKEYGLGKRLLSLHIITPRPLAYGLGAKGSFVVQEWVDARTFKSAFEEGRDRARLLDDLAHLLRQLTSHRIAHNDLHLENVIVVDGVVQLIDLHKTKIGGRFSRRDEITNLTHALTMIYHAMTEEEKQRFFTRYGSPDVRPFVERGLEALRIAWIRNKKKRAFSSTSKLFSRDGRVYIRGQQDRAQGALQEVLKKDRKVVVARHSGHIRKIFGTARRLKKAWENHVVLEYLEQPVVPRPFCVSLPSGRQRGYIAMEDLAPRGEELDRFLDRHYDTMSAHARRFFLDRIARFLAGLVEKGILHRDMKGCNIFVAGEEFKLLDVEDIVFSPARPADLMRMAVQLNTTLPVRIVTADRMRFFARLTKGFPERKRILREVVKDSLVREVVYEGACGLRKESWQAPSRCSRSPFSRPPG